MEVEVKLTVSEFLATVNQTLEYGFTGVVVEGEVSGFKVSQGNRSDKAKGIQQKPEDFMDDEVTV